MWAELAGSTLGSLLDPVGFIIFAVIGYFLKNYLSALVVGATCGLLLKLAFEYVLGYPRPPEYVLHGAAIAALIQCEIGTYVGVIRLKRKLAR